MQGSQEWLEKGKSLMWIVVGALSRSHPLDSRVSAGLLSCDAGVLIVAWAWMLLGDLSSWVLAAHDSNSTAKIALGTERSDPQRDQILNFI